MHRSVSHPGWHTLCALCCRLLALIGFALLAAPSPAQTAGSFLGRPIYSEPASGLQLPPSCQVDPSWRTSVHGSDQEIWIAVCSGQPRVWLLRRQVIEVVNARQARLRFEVLDERVYPEETAGDSLSVQCTGPADEPGYVVRGARWRADGKELRLKGAPRGILRADAHAQKLVDAEPSGFDCTRFPEREAMMKRLQQAH